MSDINWAEKRNALRQRTLKQGRIVVKGMSTMDCLIRNMSLTGARIAVENAHTLPDEFELLIGDEGLRRECEVMSRGEGSAGLRFAKPLTPRELGAEFMSTKKSERVTAPPPVATAPRAPVEAPPLDIAPAVAAPTGAVGLPKLRAAELPRPIARNLPWAARRKARPVVVAVER